MSQPSTSSYAALSSELAGAESLELQASGEDLQALFDHLPLAGVSRILEIGCGTGALTRGLARRLGPGVRIEGIDLSPRHIEHARELAGDLASLSYRTGDVLELDLPAAAYDLVFCRYVLMYLIPQGRSHTALERMRSLTRPGGAVACIEADIDFGELWYPPPPPELAAALRRAMRYYRDQGGIEWRAGIRLYEQMRPLGFADLRITLADGRIIQGGEPRALVDHDSQDLEQLLKPCVSPRRAGPLARQWREYLRGEGHFLYTPVFVAVGTVGL